MENEKTPKEGETVKGYLVRARWQNKNHCDEIMSNECLCVVDKSSGLGPGVLVTCSVERQATYN